MYRLLYNVIQSAGGNDKGLPERSAVRPARTLDGGQQPLPENAHGVADLGALHDPVRRRYHGQLFGVPGRVAGAADQAGGGGVERFEPSDSAGNAAHHGVERRVDDDLDVVLPPDGQMLLEHGDRVEVSGWAERAVEHLHAVDPVDPVRPPGTRAVGPAEQVPPAVAHDDRPRVDLDVGLGAGLGAV